MIKRLNEYREDEIDLLCTHSPAARRYYSIVNKTAQSFDQEIKQERLTAWLECTLATFFKNHSPRDICLYWSKAADQIIKKAAQELKLDENVSIFALGKLGAMELNLSSDIDIVFFSMVAPDDEMSKKVRTFIKMLSSSSEYGSGFRVDVDLRPGGKGSPLICHIRRFQDYYWTQSELWERMALVRLREIIGPKEINHEILEARDLFCYRKYLDYSLLEELKRLRPKVHATANNGGSTSSINLKLTPGYIRDIELFINAHQIIYGGKEPSLRTYSTERAANELNRFEKEPQLFEKLIEYYWDYRQWENQVQAINDFQTHDLDLKNKPKGWNWPDDETLDSRSRFVDKSISGLLGPALQSETLDTLEMNVDLKLKDLGFSEESINQVWPEVKRASVLSRQKSVDEVKRTEVIESFIEEISTTAFDKNLGLKGLKDFLGSIRAKATFFHLLSKEQKLIKDLSFLLCLSPYLGSLFSTRPELVDSFLFNQDEPFSNDLERSLIQMAERKWIAEIHSALSFLKSFDLKALTETLTVTADSISDHLLGLIQSETHTAAVRLLALGKWGGREVGFKSDLDFIFVTQDPPTEFHHKLVRRFISRMRDTAAGGSIYNIDTRLKPSGKGGALIVSENQLKDFLKTNASPWERQAYLKGRWINSKQCFHSLIPFEKGLSKEELQELRMVREKLILKSGFHGISLKLTEGGIVDIELALQTIILANKIPVQDGSMRSFFKALNLESSFLFSHYLELRKYEQIIRILSVESDPVISEEKSFAAMTAKLVKLELKDLMDRLRQNMEQAAVEIRKIDPTFS